jgi:hypothetical protein
LRTPVVTRGRDFLTVTARATDGRVEVSWRDTWHYNDPIGYVVYRRADPSASWRAVARLTLDPDRPLAWIDAIPPPSGSATEYGVTSVDRCGEAPLCDQAPCRTAPTTESATSTRETS